VFDKRLVIVWTSRKITDFVVISPFFIAIGLKTNLLPSVTETTQNFYAVLLTGSGELAGA
jgi:hypothetical protein